MQNEAEHLKILKSGHMGTHMRVLSRTYPMNTNMTGFRWFSKIFAFFSLSREIHNLDLQPHRYCTLASTASAPRVTRCSLGLYWSRGMICAVSIIILIIILSFDIAPFPYKHAQRRITFHCQRIDVDIHIVN